MRKRWAEKLKISDSPRLLCSERLKRHAETASRHRDNIHVYLQMIGVIRVTDYNNNNSNNNYYNNNNGLLTALPWVKWLQISYTNIKLGITIRLKKCYY